MSFGDIPKSELVKCWGYRDPLSRANAFAEILVASKWLQKTQVQVLALSLIIAITFYL